MRAIESGNLFCIYICSEKFLSDRSSFLLFSEFNVMGQIASTKYDDILNSKFMIVEKMGSSVNSCNFVSGEGVGLTLWYKLQVLVVCFASNSQAFFF